MWKPAPTGRGGADVQDRITESEVQIRITARQLAGVGEKTDKSCAADGVADDAEKGLLPAPESPSAPPLPPHPPSMHTCAVDWPAGVCELSMGVLYSPLYLRSVIGLRCTSVNWGGGDEGEGVSRGCEPGAAEGWMERV